MYPQQLLAKILSVSSAELLVVYGWSIAGVYWHYRSYCVKEKKTRTLRDFFRHLLPSDMLHSRWTKLDLALFALHWVMRLLVFPFVLGLTVAVAGIVSWITVGAIGHPGLLKDDILLRCLFLVLGLLTRDFASFYVHYLQHRVPLFWEFHKVHHAPETLIPPTARRLHPLDELMNIAGEGLLFGSVVGVQAGLTGLPAGALLVEAALLYALCNILTFSPLRHSHIDLRLGFFERIVFSPAHHQMHHSVEVAHWDKNFGSIFPVWDRLWGTYLTPVPRQAYRLGLPNGESESYSTVLGCYLAPLAKSFALLSAFLAGRFSRRESGRPQERWDQAR